MSLSSSPSPARGTFRRACCSWASSRPTERKYTSEIFKNEFVLLSYYIASINIEQVYHQVRAEQVWTRAMSSSLA